METKFIINGQPILVNLSTLPPDITLNTFIRENAQLTATKFMCKEGGCGACVCVVRGKHPVSGDIRTWAVNSCLMLLNSCTGLEIITAEGLGTQRSGYHPIQKRLAKMNGTQCGYCSPGMVMNMYGLLESRKGQVTMTEVEDSFGGNICRCTGYRPILDAMKSFAVDSNIAVPAECADIEDLSPRNCPKTGKACSGQCPKALTTLVFEDGSQWHWPKTVEELFEALAKVEASGQFMLVAGNTAHGVYRRSPDIKHFIDLHQVPELHQHTLTADSLVLGANVSLTEAMEIFKEAANQPGFEYLQQVWNHFDLIANVPVRNNGTLAGNISIKKQHPEFPSDVFICFESLDAQIVVLENAKTEHKLSLAEYLSGTNNRLVLKSFVFKAYPKEKFIFHSYKIMPRAQNVHAYVNAGFLLEVEDATFLSSTKVTKARICFGGISPDFTHATSIEQLLVGRNMFDDELLEQLFGMLSTVLQPHEILPDASPEYRTKLACGLFYKFLLHIAPDGVIKEEYKSGANILQRPLSSGIQEFATQKQNYPVTEPVNKVEGMIQCSGEATYMNDVLTTNNTLWCAFVSATKVGATIEQINPAAALKLPGVVAFYSAKDITGNNTFVDRSFGFEEEEIFCSKKVKYYDQPLGVILALTPAKAEQASLLVEVTYSNQLDRKVLPTMDAVLDAANLDKSRIVRCGKSEENDLVLSGAADINAKGIFSMGLQYHYTLEPQTTVVIPFEDGLKVFCATQWMDHTQSVIARMLQIKAKDVQLQVRRLGGGYGAKISRANLAACAAALAAYKLNRPVRFVQSIESMMSVIGKRWACRSDYEFHAQSSGKIVGLKNEFYEDAGCSLNENPVSHLSQQTAWNCYGFTESNYKLKGNAVLTDAASSTWCRAPGSVEGIAMIEQILEHVAFEVQADPADVRMLNIKDGNKLNELLPKFLHSREYYQRKKEIETYNGKNRWTKRGLGLAIMDYPVGYFGQFPATVTIYHLDGTVVISHGGIEMGQGMNTKIAQVAAFTLKIDLSYIKIESSDTLNGANSMVTGGTIGSESVCYAVRKACETINYRIKPYKKETWEDTVGAAFKASISLIASELYKSGDLEGYHVYGLALTEVELDVLTGNTQISRVDILEDAGESLSPHIDIGQIEGAFVMCLGYWLTERLVYDSQTGQLITNRTWNYSPPGAKDIPIDFRVEMIQNPNPSTAGFMRSKATGEPPCCLAISVIFALQQALQSARKDAGLQREWVRLGAPTTPETLVLNANSEITSFRLK